MKATKKCQRIIANSGIKNAPRNEYSLRGALIFIEQDPTLLTMGSIEELGQC